jgi:hypothetical protein
MRSESVISAGGDLNGEADASGSRRQRDVHRALRQQLAERDKVGRPTRTLIGFAACFVASLAVVIIATVVGQPQNYEPPLLNRTDQLVVAQWDPDNAVRLNGLQNPDVTVSWDVRFSPTDPQPAVTLTWGAYDRFGPIYLFMDDKLFSAIDLPCPGVSVAQNTPDALVTMVSGIDATNSATSPLTRVLTTDSGGATCDLKSNYSIVQRALRQRGHAEHDHRPFGPDRPGDRRRPGGGAAGREPDPGQRRDLPDGLPARLDPGVDQRLGVQQRTTEVGHQ